MLTGCLDSSSDSKDVGTLCTLIGSQSTITVMFDSNARLPKYISGHVNDSYEFDSCKNKAPDTYWMNRVDDKNEALILDLVPNSPLYEIYMNSDHSPKSRTFIDVRFYGRENCDDTPTDLGHMYRAVDMEPVYANDEKCGASGYRATVR